MLNFLKKGGVRYGNHCDNYFADYLCINRMGIVQYQYAASCIVFSLSRIVAELDGEGGGYDASALAIFMDAVT